MSYVFPLPLGHPEKEVKNGPKQWSEWVISLQEFLIESEVGIVHILKEPVVEELQLLNQLRLFYLKLHSLDSHLKDVLHLQHAVLLFSTDDV